MATNKDIPPRLADKFLNWFCKSELIEGIQGDLHESYERLEVKNWKTKFNYWMQVFKLIRPFALKNTKPLNTAHMFQNHLKTSYKNLLRNKMYTSINLLGLVLAVLVCLNVGLYVSDELSYDQFHPDHKNLYRLTVSIKSGGVVYNEAGTQFPMASAINEDFSGVEEVVRIFKPLSTPLIIREDLKYTEGKFFFADEAFFSVFGYPLIAGDPEKVLQKPNSVVISERIAQKYFGEGNPVGQVLEYNGQQLLEITGIVDNSDLNSHFDFDFISPLQLQLNNWHQKTGAEGRENKWYWTGAWTYVKFADNEKKEYVASQLPAFVQAHFPQKWKDDSSIDLQRIDDIHLTSNLLFEIKPNGSLSNLKIFSLIAIILFLLAVINFVNLMMADGMTRAFQIGIRKTLGASVSVLISQMLIETVLLCLSSGIIALVLTQWTVPYLNYLTDRSISLANYFTFSNLFLYFCLITLIGMMAGIYPAVHLARFKSFNISKKESALSKSATKTALVIFQFFASVVLIISVIIVNEQREFLLTKDLGFDKTNMLVIKARNEYNKNFIAFRNEIIKLPEVSDLCGITDVPGTGMNSSRFVPEEGNRSQPVLLPVTWTGYDFSETANIEMKYGRFFSREHPSDQDKAFVLNEEAVKVLGWTDNPIGKKLELFGAGTEQIVKEGKVVGVIKNYHYESMHHPVGPAVFDLTTSFDHYLLKFQTDDYPALIEKLESVWLAFGQKWPLEYKLLDRQLETLYTREKKLSDLVNLAVIVALIIAGIGIFGLSSFMVSKRTKEVSIRRVLGIRISHVILLLARPFIYMVAIANLIAWPVSYFLMEQWLSNFEYVVDINWLIFIIAGFVTLVITVSVTGYHAVAVTRLNPVDSLRSE